MMKYARVFVDRERGRTLKAGLHACHVYVVNFMIHLIYSGEVSPLTLSRRLGELPQPASALLTNETDRRSRNLTPLVVHLAVYLLKYPD
jgi:hypothetical protein